MSVHEGDLNEPDELRPLKRTRLEGSLELTEETSAEMADDEDWDDVYGQSDSKVTDHAADQAIVDEQIGVKASAGDVNAAAPSQPPGIQLPASQIQSAPQEEQRGSEQPNETAETGKDVDEDLVAPVPPTQSTDVPSARVVEEVAEVEMSNVDGLPTSANTKDIDSVQEGAGKLEISGQEAAAGETEQDSATTEPQAPQKVTEDAEFMAAAAEQKGNKDAEWQFDSSDAESSSDSDSSDSSDDDSDSDGGYELLDPVTAARMLMAGEGDGDDDDGDKKGKSENQPRTANEKQEEVVPKPDVTVTPDMKITLLGAVERIVDNLILIKGATPGEYQVLESGSVLCTEDRAVFGAVAETLGRVQEPLYSVMFTNSKEIEDAGLSFGTNIYYVDSHSAFVFTQPLKNLKGTDASNIHDEEVGEDEVEFSDDEVEAEFKRQKKLAKKAGRGGFSRGEFNEGVRISNSSVAEGDRSFNRGNDAPSQNYGGGMSYDDEEGAEEFYVPLKRPDNLSQLMAGGPAPPQHHDSDRGRGRGGFRGRGRGDRGGRGDPGRGRGGFDRGRGGRGGGGHNNTQPHRGNAQSFPDRHNTNTDSQRQERAPLPPRPVDRPQPGPSAPTYANQYQQQAPQSYQFNGYTFQYGNYLAPGQQPGQYGAQQASPPSIPPGSYVNPAFAHMQQYQQPSHPQQAYPAWNAHPQPPAQPQQYPQYQYQGQPPPLMPQSGPQQPPAQSFPPDISQILKNLGAQR